MEIPIFYCLLALAGSSMLAERLGAKLTLNLQFKGDIKRESRWLAQYGQGVCTIVIAMLIYRLDGRSFRWDLSPSVLILVGVFGASVLAMILKRLLGRVRPGREQAGKFLGPTLTHANYRESFPSSHAAAAVATSLLLARLYPQAAAIFWGLAIITSLLRYVMDAHWPSDVLGGMALGYATAWFIWHTMGA